MADTTIEKKPFDWSELLNNSLGPIGAITQGVFNLISSNKTNENNMSIAKLNLSQQQDALDYNKELNKNQIQWQAADALKAGINPLAMQGGSMQGASYSNIDANQQAPQLTGIAEALSAVGQMRQQKQLADDSNTLQRDIANQSNELQIKLQNDKLQQEAEQAQKDRDLELQKQQAELNFQREQNELNRQQELALQKDTSAREWNKYQDEHERSEYQMKLERLKYLDSHEEFLQNWYQRFLNDYRSYQDDLNILLSGEYNGELSEDFLGLIKHADMLKLAGQLNINPQAFARFVKSLVPGTSYAGFKAKLENAINSPSEFGFSPERYSRYYQD